MYVTDSYSGDIAVSTNDQIVVTSGDNTVMSDSDDIYVVEDANIENLNIIYDDYGQPSIAVVEFEDQSYWSSDNNLIVSVQPSSGNEPIVTTTPSDYENVTQQSISAIEDLMSSISYWSDRSIPLWVGEGESVTAAVAALNEKYLSIKTILLCLS